MAADALSTLRGFWGKLCSRRIQKLCIRGLLVFVAMLVLIVDTRTARVLGPSNIFALALAVVIPPFFPVSLHILVTLAFMILMLSCWACANLITAAADAARSPALLAQEIISAESTFIPGLPTELQNAVFIFTGHYLDPRASAVTGALLFASTWMYGLILAYNPALAIAVYFALTLISSVATVNPLIPYPIYTSSLTFLVSSACYLALCIISYMLVFPSSFNASWMVGIRQDVLGPLIRFLDSNPDAQLETGLPSNNHLLAHTSDVSTTSLKAALSNVESFKFALQTEFSVHRLAPHEHLELMELYGRLVKRAGELEAVQDTVKTVCGVPRNTSADIHEAEKEPLENTLSPDVTQVFNSASDTLRVTLQVALLDIEEWMKECDMDSWGDALRGLVMSIKYTAVMKKYRGAARKKADYRRVRVEISRSNLRAAMAKFRKGDLKAVLKVIRGQDQDGEIRQQSKLQEKGGQVLLAYLNALNQLGKSILDMHAFLIRVETKEPYPMIRFPPAFINLFRARTSPDDSPRRDTESQPDSPTSTTDKDKHREDPNSVGVDSQIASSSDHSEGIQYQSASHVVFSSTIMPPELKRTPSKTQSESASASALPPSPRKKRQASQRKITFWGWLSSNEVIFAFRVAAVTVALWIPVVCKSTTALFERNYGIFAVVLGQSYLTVYAGEQVLFFLLRFMGTFVGILVTAACSYISAGGDGRGNGFVLVVITTVFISPVVFLVASGSSRYTLLSCVSGAATMATMVALVWADVRSAPSGASPARIVFNDLWKRILMDLIGAAAAFVMMMIPKPITMRSGFHHKLSDILSRLGDVLHTQLESDGDMSTEIEAIKGLSGEFAQFDHYLLCMRFDPRVKSIRMDLYREVKEAMDKLLLVVGQYFHNVQLLEEESRVRLHQRLIMVPDIISACSEELLELNNTNIKGVNTLNFAANYNAESLPNLSNIQTVIFASGTTASLLSVLVTDAALVCQVALNVHDIITTSTELMTLISQLKSEERS